MRFKVVLDPDMPKDELRMGNMRLVGLGTTEEVEMERDGGVELARKSDRMTIEMELKRLSELVEKTFALAGIMSANLFGPVVASDPPEDPRASGSGMLSEIQRAVSVAANRLDQAVQRLESSAEATTERDDGPTRSPERYPCAGR